MAKMERVIGHVEDVCPSSAFPLPVCVPWRISASVSSSEEEDNVSQCIEGSK